MLECQHQRDQSSILALPILVCCCIQLSHGGRCQHYAIGGRKYKCCYFLSVKIEEIRNWMEQDQSWEPYISSASQQIPFFYGTKGSLLCSYEYNTGSYPESKDPVSSLTSCFCKRHFNFVSSMPVSSKWSCFRFSDTNFICIPRLPHFLIDLVTLVGLHFTPI